MWRILIVVAACGRVDFAPDEVYDVTGVVPYEEDDFADDDGSFLSNGPAALTAMPDGFAVSLGRAIVHVGFDGSREVHDYRPAMAGTTGPDEIVKLAYSDGGLWACAESILKGDGLFRIDASWGLVRDQADNNVGGVAVDGDEVYFIAGNRGVVRRSDSAIVVPFAQDVGALALTAEVFYAVDADPDTDDRLWAIDRATGARTLLESSASEQIADLGAGADGVLVIRTLSDLVRVAPDGTRTVVASAPVGVEWHDAAVMSDGRIAVLEFAPATDAERVRVLPAP